MKTLQERFLAALLKRGEAEVKRTSKYIVVTRTIEGISKGYYYLGKSGALRGGQSVQGSVPCNDTLKQALLKEVENGSASSN